MARWLERRWNLFATALALNIAAGCTSHGVSETDGVRDVSGMSE